MRKANVYFRDIFAGSLEETETGYRFTYDSRYLEQNRRPSDVCFYDG